MSHFGVLVLAPPETSYDEARTAIEPLLAPYDEDIQVKPYEKDCYCVNKEARDFASKEINDERNMIRERVRAEFTPINEAYIKLAPKEDERDAWGILEYDEAAERIAELPESPKRDELLKKAEAFVKLFNESYEALEAKHKTLEEKHPRYQQVPVDGCPYDEDGCKGTGKVKTTYNPKSQWDWYVVGGRWAGALIPEYDPNEDPRNKEICWLCHGTGKRTDMEVKDGCNSCHGTGIARKFKNEPFKGDVIPVAGIPNPEWEKSFYALVTPDGQWHQRGKMGWFGMSHDEMSKDDWREYLRKEVAKYPDHTAVVVDCHI